MKPQFTQNWQHAEILARHAWKFYLNYPDATIDTMSRPSYSSWIACNAVWDKLKPSEQEIVREFHVIKTTAGENQNRNNQTKISADRIFKNQNVTEDYIWSVIRKAWKLWAIERGLADE